MKRSVTFPLLLLAMLLCGGSAKASRWYVDISHVTGTHNGLSWTTAFDKFENGVTAAAAGDTIWVAKGNYTPPAGASFSMKGGVIILGGFSGTETVYTMRDWTLNVTILSGNNNRVIDNGSNALTTTAVLDGFTVTGGSKDFGGGMYNAGSSPSVFNCTFAANSANTALAQGGGGGMYNKNASPVVTNCIFTNNNCPPFSVAEGGAMYNVNSSAIITGCTFSDNRTGIANRGGAVFNKNAAVSFTGCTFSNNYGAAEGGAIANDGSASAITGCSFLNNTNLGGGAAVYNLTCSPAITNCIFTANISDFGAGGAIYNNTNASPVISGCTFSGNRSSNGSGTGAGGGGGAIYNHYSCSPVIKECSFTGNNCTFGGQGGAVCNNVSCSPLMTNCNFTANFTIEGSGGALANNTNSTPVITNCRFTGNSAGAWGGAVSIDDCSPIFRNCTFAGNKAVIDGGAIRIWDGSPVFENSIIYGNSNSFYLLNATPVVTYSIIQGGFPGTGNLAADPQFVAPVGFASAPSAAGNYHLQAGSPAVNSGNNAAVAPGNIADLDGFARIQGITVDRGAYEQGTLLPCGAAVTISVSPSMPVCAGTGLTFTAIPTNGGTAPAYQWQVNGINSGTNSPAFSGSSFINGDVIKVILTSDICTPSVTAASNSLTVQVTPSVTPSVNIIATPSGTVCPNTAITFNASGTNGGAAPVYQWQVNGINTGSNAASFTSSSLVNGDIIKVIYTSSLPCNAGPATSAPITMQVSNATPTVAITANPVGSICTNTSVTFTAAATNGGSAPSYQWLVNGVNSGTNAASFTAANFGNGDIVKVIMTSNAACVSTAPVTSNAISMQVTGAVTPAVSISASPAGTVCTGSPVTFTAVAQNPGNMPVFQWKINGSNAGTNLATFTTTALLNNNVVTVVLTSNAACVMPATAVSNGITVSVSNSVAPAVTISANTTAVCPNNPVTFTALGSNTGANTRYQWKINGNNTGTDSPVFTNSNWVSGDAVSCILTTQSNCAATSTAVSNTLLMTVYQVPVISINPAGATIAPGNTVQLNAVISGSYSGYTWLPAATLTGASSLSPIANPGSTTLYTLSVSTADNCSIQKTALVTVASGLFMPNSFTPNGDGKNDLFRIPAGSDLSAASFRIYNRYGELIFATADITAGWNGNYKGKKAPLGTYTYIIEAVNSKGSVELKGTVLLIR